MGGATHVVVVEFQRKWFGITWNIYESEILRLGSCFLALWFGVAGGVLLCFCLWEIWVVGLLTLDFSSARAPDILQFLGLLLKYATVAL